MSENASISDDTPGMPKYNLREEKPIPKNEVENKNIEEEKVNIKFPIGIKVEDPEINEESSQSIRAEDQKLLAGTPVNTQKQEEKKIIQVEDESNENIKDDEENMSEDSQEDEEESNAKAKLQSFTSVNLILQGSLQSQIKKD